jgi:hypothetical protein
MDQALESWLKRLKEGGPKLNSVTQAERDAIDVLIQATWDAQHAGLGADAKNLQHSRIQVLWPHPLQWLFCLMLTIGFFLFLFSGVWTSFFFQTLARMASSKEFSLAKSEKSGIKRGRISER